MKSNSKIYIAGHTGMVGSAILRSLTKNGYHNLIYKRSSELDLTNQSSVFSFFKKNNPEFVIIAAAKVGGINANEKYKANFLYENLMIQNNLIHSSYLFNVKKLLFLGSSCIYPKNSNIPISEDSLLSGKLEKTNEAYALAKISGIKMCEYYNNQFSTNFISIMPTNLYGPNDNFDLETSHVLPALLKKVHNAKIKKSEFVSIWGTGNPLREFLHVDDLSKACIFLMKNYSGSQFLNVGSGFEISIHDLTMLIMKIVKYKCNIQFDSNKPDGALRKLINSNKIINLGWKPEISLEEGISDLYYNYFN